jgi:hypothetical protein
MDSSCVTSHLSLFFYSFTVAGVAVASKYALEAYTQYKGAGASASPPALRDFMCCRACVFARSSSG